MNPDILVHIKANAIVASNNIIKDFRIERLANLNLVIQKNCFTVLGNVLTGFVAVNGASLTAPWNALNVQNAAF